MTFYFELQTPDGTWHPQKAIRTGFCPFLELLDNAGDRWIIYESKKSTKLLEYNNMLLYFPVRVSCSSENNPAAFFEQLIPSRIEAIPEIVILEPEGAIDVDDPAQHEQSIDALSESQSMGTNDMSGTSCDHSFSDMSSVKDNMSDASF